MHRPVFVPYDWANRSGELHDHLEANRQLSAVARMVGFGARIVIRFPFVPPNSTMACPFADAENLMDLRMIMKKFIDAVAPGPAPPISVDSASMLAAGS